MNGDKIILLAFVIYLVVGALVIFLFDLQTGRVRTRIKSAATETQMKLATGSRTSVVLTLTALWLLWPVMIYGALTSPKHNSELEKGEPDERN